MTSKHISEMIGCLQMEHDSLSKNSETCVLKCAREYCFDKIVRRSSCISTIDFLRPRRRFLNRSSLCDCVSPLDDSVAMSRLRVACPLPPGAYQKAGGW